MKNSYISWEHCTEEDCYLIAHLFVSESDRRKGIGSKMLQKAIEEMRADGEYGVIRLSADSESEDADSPVDAVDLVEFYESNGFEVEFAGEIIVMRYEI